MPEARTRAAEALRELRDAALRGEGAPDTPLDVIDELLDWLDPLEVSA